MLQSDVKQPTQLITGDEAPQRHHLDPISASEQLLVRDFSPVAPHSTVHLVQFDQSVHPAKNMLFQVIKLLFLRIYTYDMLTASKSQFGKCRDTDLNSDLLIRKVRSDF